MVTFETNIITIQGDCFMNVVTTFSNIQFFLLIPPTQILHMQLHTQKSFLLNVTQLLVSKVPYV